MSARPGMNRPFSLRLGTPLCLLTSEPRLHHFSSKYAACVGEARLVRLCCCSPLISFATVFCRCVRCAEDRGFIALFFLFCLSDFPCIANLQDSKRRFFYFFFRDAPPPPPFGYCLNLTLRLSSTCTQWVKCSLLFNFFSFLFSLNLTLSKPQYHPRQCYSGLPQQLSPLHQQF